MILKDNSFDLFNFESKVEISTCLNQLTRKTIYIQSFLIVKVKDQGFNVEEY